MSESSDRPRVLVVDDEPTNIKILGEVLKDDYAVSFALNGKDALAAAAADPQPDLILLDLLMPEMDGFMVCARLKADERTAHIPVIFVTMIDDQVNEERGFRVGAVDYVSKPLKPTLVKARVKLHLRLKQHRDFLERLVEHRTGELEAAREEARELLERMRADSVRDTAAT